MMRSLLLVLIIAFYSSGAHAEHKPKVQTDTAKNKVTCVYDIFHKGHTNGNIRIYNMNTLHPTMNHWYYATAFGGRINYHSASFKGFSMGIGGVFIFGVDQIDFGDTLLSRFEHQLFDLEHPNNINDLDRLEELYLQYHYGHGFIKVGKMDINTPLMNMQDTRMKPFVFRGIWAKHEFSKQFQVHAGFFDKVSPRSTTHWYRIEDAIGIYNQGLDEAGHPAHFHGKLSSRGIGVLGLHYHTDQLGIQSWNYWLDGISNSNQVQIDYLMPQSSKLNKYKLGMIYLNQSRLNSANADNVNYTLQSSAANLLSFRVERKQLRHTISLNHTYVLPGGAFIFPQEFGREQFYTTISRGRIEGMGHMHTTGFINTFLLLKDKNLEFSQMIMHNQLLRENDAAMNKYGESDNLQWAVDANIKFHKFFNGSSLRFLYVGKNQYGAQSSLSRHRSLYHHFNLVLNIDF